MNSPVEKQQIKAAAYLRVSTSNKAVQSDTFRQNPDVQIQPIAELIQSRGWKLVRTYTDRMSGSRDDRPEYKRLMQDAHLGKFQVVVVWSLDRWSRSLKELIVSIERLKELQIDFCSCQFPIDTTTSAGKLMFQIIGAFGEFERELIRERIRAGMDYAKQNGTRSGNPIGPPRRVFDRSEVLRLRGQGMSIRKIAAHLHLGHGTVERMCTTNQPEKSGKRDGTETG